MKPGWRGERRGGWNLELINGTRLERLPVRTGEPRCVSEQISESAFVWTRDGLMRRRRRRKSIIKRILREQI